MCDFHLGTNGWPQDFECINGVAIDIDNYTEGSWEMSGLWLAPCHPHYCKRCNGTGETVYYENGVPDGIIDCPDCNGSGATNGENDFLERLASYAADARAQMAEEEISDNCTGGDDVHK
jgi:hypothetical protein